VNLIKFILISVTNIEEIQLPQDKIYLIYNIRDQNSTYIERLKVSFEFFTYVSNDNKNIHILFQDIFKYFIKVAFLRGSISLALPFIKY
jgi:hypothetical protein